MITLGQVTKRAREAREASRRGPEKTWDYFVRMGLIDGNTIKDFDYSRINGSLKGQPLVVIGSGYSGKGVDWDALGHIKTLAVNHVIDLLPNADMLIFQDQRFFRFNKRPLDTYPGKIFIVNNNPGVVNIKNKNIIPFFPLPLKTHVIEEDMSKGLYSRCSTGLCATHLAICLGADPIYLVGMDTPKSYHESADFDDIHIDKSYAGGVNSKEAIEGYLKYIKMFRAFIPYQKRIINVCPDGYMKWFPRMSMESFNKTINRRRP